MTTDTKADQMDQYTSSSGRVWVPLADHERVVRELETHYWEAIDYAQEALAASRAEVEGLRKAVGTVCEGWTLPEDARKVLEKALWANTAMEKGNV